MASDGSYNSIRRLMQTLTGNANVGYRYTNDVDTWLDIMQRHKVIGLHSNSDHVHYINSMGGVSIRKIQGGISTMIANKDIRNIGASVHGDTVFMTINVDAMQEGLLKTKVLRNMLGDAYRPKGPGALEGIELKRDNKPLKELFDTVTPDATNMKDLI